MHQSKKGNQWHFVRLRACLASLGTATVWRRAPSQGAAGGAKAHIGVDAATGLVRRVKLTAAHVADGTVAPELIRPEDEVVHADAGYPGLARREALKQAQQAGKLQPKLTCEVALRAGQRRALAQQGEFGLTLARIEQLKARIRAKVEHLFQWLKQRCGLGKLRYRGLKKNEVQCYAIFALGNLMRARSLLREADGLGAT
jgi:Transposase DDE domain.